LAPKLLLEAVTSAYRALARGARARFREALSDPDRAQGLRLKRFLAANDEAAYGRAHGYTWISSVREFQDRVPIADYDALAGWIDRIGAGEKDVLTVEPVRMLERSGGSTGKSKLVPYTEASLAEFSEAASAWIADLLDAHPPLRRSKQYWSLSPVARAKERTPGGIPVGIEDDTEYFGRAARWGMRQLMAVPSSVAHAPDMESWRRQTLLHLLGTRELGLFSVWSPTFLTALMDALGPLLPQLLPRLPRARARELSAAIEEHGLVGEALWPELSVVSCWCDATAAEFLPALRAHFPTVQIQPKGLLATEGVVSIPLEEAKGPLLAVTSHFLEFIDLEKPDARPLLASELRPGAAYSPLITTGAGLARYHLKDVVRCAGTFARTPVVRFEGRLDRVSDLAGEKLHERQVDRALAAAQERSGCSTSFALLAPTSRAPAGYVLLVESAAGDPALARLAAALEEELSALATYRYARDLGQLAPLRFERVERGWELYASRLVAEGQRQGDIKPTHLDARPGLAEELALRRARA